MFQHDAQIFGTKAGLFTCLDKPLNGVEGGEVSLFVETCKATIQSVHRRFGAKLRL